MRSRGGSDAKSAGIALREWEVCVVLMVLDEKVTGR